MKNELFDGFTINITLDEDGDWLAHLAELPSVSAFSDSPEKAVGLLAPYAFHCHAKDFHFKPGTAPNPGIPVMLRCSLRVTAPATTAGSPSLSIILP